MPGLTSPYKAATRRSASPLPPAPPPKPIDLNSSTRSTDRETGQKITKRAFHCDLVLADERIDHHASSEATANLLSHLGQPLQPLSCMPPTAGPSRLSASSMDDEPQSWSPKKKEDASKRLGSLFEELVRTERSYLSRIRTLKTDYADPLREFSKDKSTQIIPAYEAKNLFANIDQVVVASAAFLVDLEQAWAAGYGPEVVGDICLRHLKELPTFNPYRAYLSKQDEVQRLFQETLKKYSGFGTFIESTKYRTLGIGNIGLRELLMEPVQRIPRYTLLWQTMTKCMSPISRQRTNLLEAVEIASRIAKCEPDPQTIRATVMYCLQRHVEDFPADLFSSKRNYIDSLDVDDVPTEYHSSPGSRASTRPTSTSSTTSTSTPSLTSVGSSAISSAYPASPPPYQHLALSTLHCTLFLLDDKLLIVKRQSASVSGRKTTGLDDVAKLVKTGGGISVMEKGGTKKDKLVYRGSVDVLDVIASDVGNGDFHLFFERPPMDQSERWSGRPFRAYTAVNPPYIGTLDVGLRKDKSRFLQNLWTAQATARSKLIPKGLEGPRAMASLEESSLDAAGEFFARAKCFWTVWQAKSYQELSRRAKVLVQVNELGHFEEPILRDDGPCLAIHLQPLPGGLCRFSYVAIGDDEEEREVIDMGEVVERVATTVHRYGIFRFRTSNSSAPATPSATARLRPSMLNLDAISRNLFGTGSVSSRSYTSSNSGDMFSTVASKRSKALSRSTTGTSSRLSTSSDEKRLSRMSFSPESSGDEKTPVRTGSPYKPSTMNGQSEVDLNERLNLARRNSKSMAALSPRSSKRVAQRSMGELRNRGASHDVMDSIEDQLFGGAPPIGDPLVHPIYPRTAPLQVRNKSPSPTKAMAIHTPELPMIPITSPLNLRDGLARSYTPTPTSPSPLSPRGTRGTLIGPRSPGLGSRAGLPQGPRSPGPRPIPIAQPTAIGSAHTRLRVVSGNGRRVSVGRETIPLKGGSPDPPRASSALDHSTPIMLAKRQHSEDHLTPRKRSPTRSPLEPRISEPGQVAEPLRIPSAGKKSPRKSPIGLGSAPGSRRSSGARTPRHLTPRKVSTASIVSTATVTSNTTVVPGMNVLPKDHADVGSAIDAATRKMFESHTAARRIREDITIVRKHLEGGVVRVGSAAGSLPRSPHRRDMRRLMDSDTTSDFASPPRGVYAHSLAKQDLDQTAVEDKLRGMAAVSDRLERTLRDALGDIEGGRALLPQLLLRSGTSSEMDSLRETLAGVEAERDGLRQQLGEAQVEVDTIYEAFNSELDGLFQDAQLPETEAWQAMQNAVKQAKEERNALKLENIRLMRELSEMRGST